MSKLDDRKRMRWIALGFLAAKHISDAHLNALNHPLSGAISAALFSYRLRMSAQLPPEIYRADAPKIDKRRHRRRGRKRGGATVKVNISQPGETQRVHASPESGLVDRMDDDSR